MRRESIGIGIVCFILGISSGIVLQWPVAKPGDDRSAATRPNEKRSRISTGDALILDSALERVRKPLGNATGDLSDESIRAMLDELTADHKCWDTKNPSRAIINALVKEWTERDHKAAWEWASTLHENNLLEEFSAEVLRQMAHVNLDESMRLMLTNYGRMSYGWADDIMDEMMSAAARGGIEAMKRITGSLPEEISPYYWNISFPVGFDFEALAEAMRKDDQILGPSGQRTLVRNWVKVDPEAAWKWWLSRPYIRGIPGERDNAMTLAYGYAEIHGQEPAMSWLVEKFVKTYGENAASKLADMADEFSDSPSAAITIALALPSIGERDYFLERVVRYQMQESTARAKVILESLSSDETRIRFLRNSLSDDSWGDEERTFMQDLLTQWGGQN